MQYLPLLVDNGNSILQLDIMEQTGQEDVGHADQTVVLLLVEERVGSPEVRAQHLQEEDTGDVSVPSRVCKASHGTRV